MFDDNDNKNKVCLKCHHPSCMNRNPIVALVIWENGTDNTDGTAVSFSLAGYD